MEDFNINGNPTKRGKVFIPLLISILMLGLVAGFTPTVFAAPGITHNQCQPGEEADPPNTDIGKMSNCIVNQNPSGWKSGLNHGPFARGESIPYRALMTNTVVGTQYTLILEYDTTKAFEHAIGYLTDFDRTMTNADACSDHGNALICADVDTGSIPGSFAAIPLDDSVGAGVDGVKGNGDDINQIPGSFTLYGGTINSVSYIDTNFTGKVIGDGTEGSQYSYVDSGRQRVKVVYTIDQESTNKVGPVLTWGGHIERNEDWAGMANPSGSPYHMQFISWTCNNAGGCSTGQQDLALTEAAIVPGEPDITIDKFTTNTPQINFAVVDPDTRADEGDTIAYSFLVTNTGNVPLTDVTVSDALISSIDCPYTELAAASDLIGVIDEMTCTALFAIPQLALDGPGLDVNGAQDTDGDIDNSATASGVFETTTVTAMDIEVVPIVQVPFMDVSKVVKSITNPDATDGGETVDQDGDKITYDITLTNMGNITLTTVTVDDDLTGTIDAPCGDGTLAPDAFCTVTVMYTASQADIDNNGNAIPADGKIHNTATGDSDQTDPKDASAMVPIAQLPSLTVEKSSLTTLLDEAPFLVTYKYFVENTGNVNITDLSLIDDNINEVNGIVSCDSSTIAVNESTNCTATHTFTQTELDAGFSTTAPNDTCEDGLYNVVTASSSAPDAMDDLCITIEQDPKIEVIKQADTSSLSNPGTVTYTYTVNNIGNVTLTDLSLIDDNIDNNIGEVDCGAVTTLTVAPDAGSTTICMATHLFTQAELDAGFSKNANVAVDVCPTGLYNGVMASSLEGATDTDNVCIPILQTPDFMVTKTADPKSIGEPGTITYTITVENTGNVTLSGHSISDPLLDGTLSGPGASDLGLDGKLSPVPAEEWMFTGTYDVSQAVIDAKGVDSNGDFEVPTDGDIDNTVTVSFAETGEKTADALVNVVAIDLVKSLNGYTDNDGSTTITLGDELYYKFDVTNIGSLTLDTVFVDDLTFALTVTCLKTVLIPDEATVCSTGTNPGDGHIITLEEANAGVVSNQAQAFGTDPNEVIVSDLSIEVETPVEANPEIVIEKSTSSDNVNFTDADNKDGSDVPEITAGDMVYWKYTVSNIGDVTVSNIIVQDLSLKVGEVLTCPDANVNDLDPAESFECTASGVAEDLTFTTGLTGQCGLYPSTPMYQNKGEASGTFDGTPVSDDDLSHYCNPQVPEIELIKTGEFQDENGDGFADVDESISYSFTVTNKGNVPFTNVTVADLMTGVSVSGGPIALLAPGASDSTSFTGTYAVTQADIDAGTFFNNAEACGTSATGETCDPDDHEEPLPQNPSIEIVKDFDPDSVVAGGSGGAFTLVVTNDGNVTLSDIVITDLVDSRLAVTSITSPAGFEFDNSGLQDNDIEWRMMTLAPTGSFTITVMFDVASSVAAGSIDNTGNADGKGPQDQPVDDDDLDTLTITTVIDLDILKTFVPDSVTAGSSNTFTLLVSNAGPSDAEDVLVTDSVDAGLQVTNVALTSGTGNCDATAGQEISCTVQITAGGTALITVTYTAIGSNSVPQYGTTNGSEFTFVFVNGSVLQGSSTGIVTLNGVVIQTKSKSKNEYTFDPPAGFLIPGVDDPAFNIHLSCSDPFTNGWGQTSGPVQGVDVNWQVDTFSITRYKRAKFFKSCGVVTINNTAYAEGSDSIEVSNTASVTIE